VRFAIFKSANISQTVKAGRDVSKEHEYETKVDLSIGQVVSARWRHLPPVPANDRFSRILKALYNSGKNLLLTFPQKQQKSV
jgi:hypothetical protein